MKIHHQKFLLVILFYPREEDYAERGKAEKENFSEFQ